jgi:hypothetical protein
LLSRLQRGVLFSYFFISFAARVPASAQSAPSDARVQKLSQEAKATDAEGNAQLAVAKYQEMLAIAHPP